MLLNKRSKKEASHACCWIKQKVTHAFDKQSKKESLHACCWKNHLRKSIARMLSDKRSERNHHTHAD